MEQVGNIREFSPTHEQQFGNAMLLNIYLFLGTLNLRVYPYMALKVH